MFSATIVPFKNQIFAHAVGQPPYFKVDGIYSDYYPVPLGSTSFEIPNDLAKGVFVAGKPIEFEIETATLGIPQEVVDVSTFFWDFGDGAKAEGLKNTHAYQKPGSYFQKIEVTYPEITGNQILQTTLVNVMDKEGEEAPKVKISVNGKEISDPLIDVSFIPSGQDVELSAELEGVGDASFTWDLGNGQTSTEKTIKTKYQKEQYREQFFPIVRAKSGDFYADAYAQITTNKEYKQGGQALTEQSTNSDSSKVIIAAAILIAAFVAYKIVKRKRK